MAKTSGAANERGQSIVSNIVDAVNEKIDTGAGIKSDDILAGIGERPTVENVGAVDSAGYATNGQDESFTPPAPPAPPSRRMANTPSPTGQRSKDESKKQDKKEDSPKDQNKGKRGKKILSAGEATPGESMSPAKQKQSSNENLAPDIRVTENGTYVDNVTGEPIDNEYLSNLTDKELNSLPQSIEPSTPNYMQGMEYGNPRAVQQARLANDLITQARPDTPPEIPVIPSAKQTAPRYPKGPQVPRAPKQETREDALRRVMDQYENLRVSEAAKNDLQTMFDYTSWRANNPQGSAAEYFNAVNPSLDIESFSRESHLQREKQENLDTYNEEVQRNGLRKEAEKDYKVQPEKDRKKYDHLIMQTKVDMKRGFFPVEGMKVKKDDAGNEVLRWGDDVEGEIVETLRYVNRENTIKNQRDLMRSIRMYASMSVDRQGKMFNEDSDSWELTENEMISIMRMMRRSCKQNRTPFSIVSPGFELRGTKVFPNGVVPKTVAEFWTGPGSNLTNEDGSPMTPSQLVQRTQDEWNQRTRPALIAYAEPSQRVVIEDMSRALSMLDGISASRFSERYGIRSEVDYMIDEWQDANAEYAAVMNNYIDANAVRDRQDMILDGYRSRFNKMKGAVEVYDDSGRLESVIINSQPGWISGLKLATKLMRAASVGLNIPVITSAFAEHGVGNLTTRMTISTLNHIYGTDYDFSQFTYELLKSDEALEAFKCVKELYDSFGPGAVRMFAETGKPYTKENVLQFAAENLKPKMGEKAQAFSQKLDKLTQTLMVADYAFKRSDLRLWFDSYVVTNAIMAQSQQIRSANGQLSQREAPLTPEEIESALRASDMGMFFSQVMGTEAGINAYQMMRANNIGQKSPLSEFANQFLEDHAVGNAAITAFVDTFPQYGINFAYMLTPFSRTISYVRAHKKLSTETLEETGANDLLIGGNIEDYQLGLRMNLIYDAFTFGGRSVIVGSLLGILLNMLGFDPPDDEENKFNVSMWKIGSKVGWGDVDENGNHKGIEVQLAWWMNDLSLLSLPIAYLIAGGTSTGDWGLAKDLMLDSLGDTVSGNVLLDFARTVNHWREDYIEFDRMIREPDYEGPTDVWSYTLEESTMAVWKAIGKMNPFDPVVNMFNRDTFFTGENARNRDFGHIWKRSYTDEDLDKFYRENKITEKVPGGYDEYLRRKYSSNNLIFALANNLFNGVFDDDKKTGYFWWDMPARQMGDPLGYAWLGEFFMDFDNIPNEVPGDTAAEKEINFKNMRAKQVLQWIDKFDGATNQAIRAGFVIPEEARKAATNYCYAQISALKAEYVARVDSGELATFEEQQSARQAMWDEINNKWNKYIYNWLKNDDIPTYAATYEQLLTDYDVSYVWRSNGQPAPIWASALPGATDAIYKPKGNHPTSFAPLTVVDTRNRGYNAETLPEWYSDGITGSDLQWIFDNIGKNVIPFGRDKDKVANDVIFGKQPDGSFTNLDEPTIGWRSYVSRHNSGIPDSVRDITEENHEGGKLGELGKYNQDVEDKLNGTNKTTTTRTPTYYPRSTYGIGTRSSSGSYEYNPKIYSMKAQNTHTTSPHVSSVRVDSSPRSVNADKAATMYTKQPQDTKINSYLRPSFTTKGSREAYKRQDI